MANVSALTSWMNPTNPDGSPKVRSRRFVELILLIFAVSIGSFALYLIDPESAAAPGSVWMTGTLVLAGGSALIHAVLYFRARYADPFILPLVVALNGIGLAMIFRVDANLKDKVGNGQLFWTGCSMVLAAIILMLLKNHRVLRSITYTSLAVSFVLLIMPLIPGLGVEINGARIWISLAGRTFQPGEVAKITLAIFFAGYLATHRDLILAAGKKIGPVRLPRLRDLAPVFVAWVISLGVLVFQKDLGSAILFFGLFMAMLYLATEKTSWLLIGLIGVAAGAWLAYNHVDHVHARIYAWVHAFDPQVYNSPYGGSGQILQGVFGLAYGGLFGRGWGEGRTYLVPYANSDMIITSLGEELGLLGLGAILMMYLLLISRGFRAALGTRDAFGKLLSAGLCMVMVLQLFVVIGGVTRLIPLTGLTTPFMSAGGSSLVANWIIVALWLSISHSARAPHVVSTFDAPSGIDHVDDSYEPEGATSVLARITDSREGERNG